MALHYHPCPDEERPLVFGMTASPMSGNGDNIEQAIKLKHTYHHSSSCSNALLSRQLETNLYSKAITPDSHSDLRHYTVAPTKQIVPYPPPTLLQTPILLHLYSLGITQHSHLRSLCFDAETICQDVGGWVADVFLREAFKELWHSFWEGGRIKKRRKEKVKKLIREDRDLVSGMVLDVGEVVDEDESVGVDATDNGEILSSPSRRTRSDEDGVLYGGGLMDWDTQFSVDEQEAVEEARLKEFIKVVCEYLDERWHDSGDQDSQDPTFPSNVVKSFSFAAKKSILPESLVKSLSPKLLT
ncbi:hypothetical protein HDU99_008776, partial [Rhizoclosmatium hyalinum]